MARGPEDRYYEFAEQGWLPPHDARSYVCGWCGRTVSSQLGMGKSELRIESSPLAPLGVPNQFNRDVRVCTHCACATTFIEHNQLPGPLPGEHFEAKGKGEHVELIVTLFNEARFALRDGAASCATLMFRKLLMHIAVEQGAKAGLKFVQYVEHLKDEGVVGKPQHGLLTRIKDAGNDENHDVRRASIDEARDLLDLASLLIRSVYFAA